MIVLISKYLKYCKDEEEELIEKVTIMDRLKLIEENFNSRESYLKYINFIEDCIKSIQKYEGKMINNIRNQYYVLLYRKNKVDDISRRVMIGLGNDVYFNYI